MSVTYPTRPHAKWRQAELYRIFLTWPERQLPLLWNCPVTDGFLFLCKIHHYLRTSSHIRFVPRFAISITSNTSEDSYR